MNSVSDSDSSAYSLSLGLPTLALVARFRPALIARLCASTAGYDDGNCWVHLEEPSLHELVSSLHHSIHQLVGWACPQQPSLTICAWQVEGLYNYIRRM